MRPSNFSKITGPCNEFYIKYKSSLRFHSINNTNLDLRWEFTIINQDIIKVVFINLLNVEFS